jgi:hypothetical protein
VPTLERAVKTWRRGRCRCRCRDQGPAVLRQTVEFDAGLNPLRMLGDLCVLDKEPLKTAPSYSVLLALASTGALAMSCSGPNASAPRSADGSACTSDSVCSSGFCDLGICSEPSSPILAYARECSSPGPSYNSGPIGYAGTENGKYATCSNFLCIDERCRSCRSAEECYEAVGAPSCYPMSGSTLKRCGWTPPPDAEIYRPAAIPASSGALVESVEQEPELPTSLRLRPSADVVVPASAHLAVVWWHQRAGEPDEFMRIAYDAALGTNSAEVSIPFASLALPFQENLICFRACRDRSVCPCEGTERFAMGSVLVAIDWDGDGTLSLDEIRSEQIGAASAVIAWAPVTTPTFDAVLDVMHRGFAAYTPVPSAPFVPVTSANAPAEALYLCSPGDLRCSFPVGHIFCTDVRCDFDLGLDSGLDRLAL